MSIEKKCSNCMNYQEIDDEDYSNCIGGSHYQRPCVENNLMFFRPSEKAIREDCINDFKEIINNIEIITNFDGLYEDLIFNKGIKEYKEKLFERLYKYSKEK